MQVVFAIQCVVDTSNSNVVNVLLPHEEIDKTVPLNRIMQGQNFVDSEKNTGVEISIHTYTPTNESITLYEEEKSGIGDNKLIRFNDPAHSLTISNGDLLEYGTNYAIINARTGCILNGKKYEHDTEIKRRKNDVILAIDKEKYVVIDNATLVSQGNVDNILDKCYNWFKKNMETNLRIVEGKHVVYGVPVKYGSCKYGEYKYGGRTEDIITYDERVKNW